MPAGVFCVLAISMDVNLLLLFHIDLNFNRFVEIKYYCSKVTSCFGKKII